MPSMPSTPSMPSNTSTSSNVMSFLSKMLASPDVMLDPSFFNTDLAGLENMFVQTCFETCELERKKEKEKKQEAVSAAVEAQIFKETVDPQQHPSLVAKNIALASDEDITPQKKKKKSWETYFRTPLKILPKMEGANSAFGKCT
jgi:hypothetical protein